MNDESIKLSKEIGDMLSQSWKMCCKILSFFCLIELLIIGYLVYRICNIETVVDFGDASAIESTDTNISYNNTRTKE